MCPIPNGFRDTAISLYSSKTVDKKEILLTVSNTDIHCSSDTKPEVTNAPRLLKWSDRTYILRSKLHENENRSDVKLFIRC
jgi:hypothetical protein